MISKTPYGPYLQQVRQSCHSLAPEMAKNGSLKGNAPIVFTALVSPALKAQKRDLKVIGTAFLPKAFPSSPAAGLLAYSSFGNLPIPVIYNIGDSGHQSQKLMELTAAGTASDFPDCSESPNSLFNVAPVTAKRPSMNQYVKIERQNNGILCQKPIGCAPDTTDSTKNCPNKVNYISQRSNGNPVNERR